MQSQADFGSFRLTGSEQSTALFDGFKENARFENTFASRVWSRFASAVCLPEATILKAV